MKFCLCLLTFGGLRCYENSDPSNEGVQVQSETKESEDCCVTNGQNMNRTNGNFISCLSVGI